MPLPDALTAALQRIAARDAERIAELERELSEMRAENERLYKALANIRHENSTALAATEERSKP